MNNSITILASQPSEMTMTLKEITDMLGVRHDKAMHTVENMSQNPDFGPCVQVGHMVEIGSGAKRSIITYALNKRQSIAVAAEDLYDIRYVSTVCVF